mgnify:CR=1 FL=1
MGQDLTQGCGVVGRYHGKIGDSLHNLFIALKIAFVEGKEYLGQISRGAGKATDRVVDVTLAAKVRACSNVNSADQR